MLLRLKGAATGGDRSPQGRAEKRARPGVELLVVNTHIKATKTAEGEKASGLVGSERGWLNCII